MSISDWSSHVCSSDLIEHALVDKQHRLDERNPRHQARAGHSEWLALIIGVDDAIGLAEPNDDRLLGFRNHEDRRTAQQKRGDSGNRPGDGMTEQRLVHHCPPCARRWISVSVSYVARTRVV